ELLDALLAAPPADLRTRVDLVELAFQNDRQDQGLHLLEQMITEQPDNIELLSSFGTRQLDRTRARYFIFGNADFAPGLRALARAAELAKQGKDLYLVQLGDGYLLAGQPVQALKCYREASDFRRANPAQAAPQQLPDEEIKRRIDTIQSH